MIEKGSKYTGVCGCCLDFKREKTVVDIHYDNSCIVIVHRCPLCEKLSRSKYKLFSSGPLASENGFTLNP